MPEEGKQNYPTYHKKIWELADKPGAEELEEKGFVFSHFADGAAHYHHPCTQSQIDNGACEHEDVGPGEWRKVDASERVALFEVTPEGDKEVAQK